MRLAVLSDVHANLPALEATLSFLGQERIDYFICAGDLVGYGPHPNECIVRVTDLPGVCVAGNHDLMALGRLTTDGCIPLVRRSLRWTRQVLDTESRARLERLPRAAKAAGGLLAVAHGALDDTQTYIRTQPEAMSQLEALERTRPHTSLLVLGHTHEPLAVAQRGVLLAGGTGPVRLEPGERYLLNPGSVGQSRARSPRARVMILDLDQGLASFHALLYDVRRCRSALRDRGLPAGSCHLPPRSAARRAAGRAYRLVRTAANHGSRAPR